MANVMYPKWDKNRRTFSSQGSEGVDVPNIERHRRVRSVKLPEFENTQLIQMLSCGGKQNFDVVVELFLSAGDVNHRQGDKHHSLVTGSQVV